MDRRSFLTKATVGTVAAARQCARGPGHRARGADGRRFPKALDTIFGAAETMAKYVSRGVRRKLHHPGLCRRAKSCPAFRPPMRSAAGTVEVPHRASYYFWGKDPTYALAPPCRSA
jgi:TRAP-type mannitol/chloroaromatic compound transport system substrate-binding protein